MALLPNGYRLEFDTPGDNPQITAEEVAAGNDIEELTGELNTPLQVLTPVQGDTAKLVQEVQTVQLDPRVEGRVTVNFGASATAFDSTSEITASLLETRLNLLTNIAAAGGVTVVALPDNVFQITFNEPGDRIPFNFEGNDLPLADVAQITDGTASGPEVQKFTAIPNQFFEIGFGADKTNRLPSTSTAAKVAAELNTLQSIIDAGGVTVTQDTGVPMTSTESYTVTFNSDGNREPLYVTNFEDPFLGNFGPEIGIAASVRAVHGFFDPADANGFKTKEVQFLPVIPISTGFFDLTFVDSKTSFLAAPAVHSVRPQ